MAFWVIVKKVCLFSKNQFEEKKQNNMFFLRQQDTIEIGI